MMKHALELMLETIIARFIFSSSLNFERVDVLILLSIRHSKTLQNWLDFLFISILHGAELQSIP